MNHELWQCTLETPLGWFQVQGDARFVTAAGFVATRTDADFGHGALMQHARQQLSDYFKQAHGYFDVPVKARGADFQQRVWKALGDIPVGQTRTYGDIARELGRPQSARAIGSGLAANPLMLVVPCHSCHGQFNGIKKEYGMKDLEVKYLWELVANTLVVDPWSEEEIEKAQAERDAQFERDGIDLEAEEY